MADKRVEAVAELLLEEFLDEPEWSLRVIAKNIVAVIDENE